MKKIKLLYAIGPNQGGAFKNVTDLATNLNDENLEISIVTSTGMQTLDTQRAISKINKKKIPVDYIYMTRRISPTDLISLIRIYIYLKTRKFDIVHAHSSKAGALFRLAAFCARIPIVIYTPHCYYFTACKGIKRYCYRFLEHWLNFFTDITVISGTEQAPAKECGIVPAKIVIIDNAIDFTEYARVPTLAVKKTLNIPADHAVIIGIGRLVKQKNWNLFIEAAKKVLLRQEKTTFLIAGDGPLKEQLTKQIRQACLTSRIKLIGYIENISMLYSIADLFVSTSAWEGLPYTYLEALYFETPMVITYFEGIEYFVEKSNCTCILQNNPSQLAKILLKKLAQSSAEPTFFPLYPFPLSACITQYEALYNRLFNAYKKSRRLK